MGEGLLLGAGTVAEDVRRARSLGYQALVLPRAGWQFASSPSYLTLGLSFAVAVAVTVAATLLPTLASLRRPEHRVIARLVAE